MAEHTKEPWKIGSSHAGKSVVFLVGDEPDHTLGPDENWIDCNTEANARRIVACVNACRGIRTEALEHRVHALAAEDDTISLLMAQRDQLQSQLEFERSAWSTKRAKLLRNYDAEFERRKNAELQLETERASLFAESQRKQQHQEQRDQLLAALDAVLPWVVTQEVACNGLKCREPVCMSCFDDSEQSAESAADAYQLAEQTIAAVKGD